MAQKLEIHYSHPGLQPPVFIAGSMCEPQWEPVEMVHKEKEDGELDFKHDFKVEPGHYQYKFRLGPGDWWVLDETKPTVHDGTGNRNNLLVVNPEPLKSTNKDAPPAQLSQKDQEKEQPAAFGASAPETNGNKTNSAANIEDDDDDDDDDIPESEKNLFKHETMQYVNGSDESDNNDDGAEYDDADDDDEQPPLLEHEAGPFERVDSKHISPLKTGSFIFDSPAEMETEANDQFADDERDAPCPLFRHETGAAVDVDPDEAPLFRHESMSPVEPLPVSSPRSRKHRPLNHQDVNDPSLEPFPTDEAGILARLQRVETRNRDDDVVFEGTPPSPLLTQTKSFSPQAPPALMTNEINDMSHLDSIDEAEETDDAEENNIDKSAEKKDPNVEPIPIAIKVQDMSQVDDNPSFADPSNRGPPTPPMTPTEHVRSKAAPHDGPADTHDLPRVGSPRSRKDNVTDHIANRPSPERKLSKPAAEEQVEHSPMSKLWVWFAGLCGGQGRATTVAVAVGVAAAAIAVNTRSA